MTIATLIDHASAVLADASADVALDTALDTAAVEAAGAALGALEVAERRIAPGISVIEARRALSDEEGDEDDDWEEKPSIHVISRAEMADVMADADVVLSF